MNTKFTRADLKSGYVVKLRNGELRMVIRAGNFTKILVAANGQWSYLNSGWNEDLLATVYAKTSHAKSDHREGESDIVEIYGLVSGTANYHASLSVSTAYRDLLWKRKKAVKMTLEEISEKLGFIVVRHCK